MAIDRRVECIVVIGSDLPFSLQIQTTLPDSLPVATAFIDYSLLISIARNVPLRALDLEPVTRGLGG